MAIKFAPKDPAKDKPVVVAKPKPAAQPAVINPDDAVPETAEGETGSDLFGSKGAGSKRKKK